MPGGLSQWWLVPDSVIDFQWCHAFHCLPKQIIVIFIILL
jgi:hypothetical protein